MSWEYRNGGKVYYQAQIDNGRVVKKYLGDGPAAQQAAAEVERRKELRNHAAAELENIRAGCREAVALSATFDGRVDELIEALLHAAGFHRHARGEWRKRRNGGNSTDDRTN